MSGLRFEDSAVRPAAQRSTFRLNRTRGKLMGVCAGLSDRFGLDVNLLRLGFAIGTIAGFGSLLLVYLLIALIAD